MSSWASLRGMKLILAPRDFRLQVCQENPGNPQSGVENFDTIYYSALQVFIVSSANGVSHAINLSGTPPDVWLSGRP